MKVFGRLFLFTAALLVALGSFVHSASEVGVPLARSDGLLNSSLNANIMTERIDRGFKLAMAERAAQGHTEFVRLPEPLIDLALRAFAVDPLEVTTIRALALGSVLQEDLIRGSRLMQVAVQISKRDPITNLWLAQDYGRRGDLDAMTDALDHALRTSMRARETAIEPLVNLLANEESYALLGELLLRNPDWEVDFWRHFVENPVSLRRSADFFASTPLAPERLLPSTRARFYNNLRALGYFDALRRLAQNDTALHSSSIALQEGEFVTVEDGHPFGWILSSKGNYASQVTKNGELQIDANAGAFGTAAERIIALSGTSNLTIHLAAPMPDNVELRLEANCASDGSHRLGVLTLKAGAKNGELRLENADCAFVRLQVTFAVDPGRRNAFVRVAKLALGMT